MVRAVLVGIAAALLTLLLLSTAVYVELRHTQFGSFVRDSAVEMRNDHVSRAYIERYGRPNRLSGQMATGESDGR